MKIFLSLLILSRFICSQTFAEDEIKPSFDCKKASSTIEKKICRSANFANLDRVLNEVYQARLKSDDDQKQKLKKDQKAWMTDRDKCLGLLPAEEEECIQNSYVKRIQDLKGTDELISMYRKECIKEDYKCLKLGNLEISLEKWQDVVADLTAACESDHDGDMGETCYKKSVALEHLGKKAEALQLATKTCKAREHNEACAAAYRLGGKKSTNAWVGLYKSAEGTLFVSELDGEKISLHADTHWANGHLCMWTKIGSIKDEKLQVEKDPESPTCLPVIERKNSTIKITDPDLACKNAYCGMRALFEGNFEFVSKSGP